VSLSICDVKGFAMKMADLSRTSGVPVATIKFYVREGLLHPGRATAVNQAEYDESHVARLRLIRALAEAGRLSLAQIGEVLAQLDDDSVSLHDALGVSQDAMAEPRLRNHDDHVSARIEVDALVDELGWRVRPEAAVRDLLADAIVLLRLHGSEYQPVLREIGAQVTEMAMFEMATVDDSSRSEAMEYTVIGTIAYEAAYAALRRLALEHASAERWHPQVSARRRRTPNSRPGGR
jgi:DNA-binding transcriptional MerR regulator